MIKKPTGYDEAAAYTGEFQQLPKGKYVCVIKRVATQKSKNGNEQFVILYDIAEGDQKGFYQKMFDNDKSQNPSGAKWRGVFKQNMEGKGLSWFKGIITSIERSNNFTFQWDRDDNEKTLNGKKFGGIFRRRQYEAENGNRPIVTGAVADPQSGRTFRGRGSGGRASSGRTGSRKPAGTGKCGAAVYGGRQWFYEYSGRSRR